MSRSACHGSAESSYDALLPLLTLLPPNLGDNTELMADFLGAVLTGWTALLSAGASSKAKQSAAACYTECWCYILAKVRLKYVRAIGIHAFSLSRGTKNHNVTMALGSRTLRHAILVFAISQTWHSHFRSTHSALAEGKARCNARMCLALSGRLFRSFVNLKSKRAYIWEGLPHDHLSTSELDTDFLHRCNSLRTMQKQSIFSPILCFWESSCHRHWLLQTCLLQLPGSCWLPRQSSQPLVKHLSWAS